MARVRRPSPQERATLREALHDAVEQHGYPWSQAIRDMRRSLGLTQDQFARLFKLTKRQVVGLEAGTANPTVATLTRLGGAFGFEIGFIRRTPPS